jgi:hypothetical protein
MVASWRLMSATSLSATRSVMPGMLISRFKLIETGFISMGAYPMSLRRAATRGMLSASS